MPISTYFHRTIRYVIRAGQRRSSRSAVLSIAGTVAM